MKDRTIVIGITGLGETSKNRNSKEYLFAHENRLIARQWVSWNWSVEKTNGFVAKGNYSL